MCFRSFTRKNCPASLGKTKVLLGFKIQVFLISSHKTTNSRSIGPRRGKLFIHFQFWLWTQVKLVIPLNTQSFVRIKLFIQHKHINLENATNYTVFQSIVINYIKGAQCKSEMCIGSLCLYSYSNSRKQGFSITLLPCHEIIVRVCDFGK